MISYKNTLTNSYFTEGNDIFKKLQQEVWENRLMEDRDGYAVNENIYIQPSCSMGKPPREYQYTIYLDAENAFGDGRHPTTSMCLASLEEALRTKGSDDLEKMKFLDAGTGTGVLAILACMAGIDHVDAVDIEDKSIASARENAENNHCSGISFEVADITSSPSNCTYDIITANLLTPIILAGIDNIYARLRPGGILIATGIGDMKRHLAEEAFAEKGLITAKHVRREGWNCYILHKK